MDLSGDSIFAVEGPSTCFHWLDRMVEIPKCGQASPVSVVSVAGSITTLSLPAFTPGGPGLGVYVSFSHDMNNTQKAVHSEVSEVVKCFIRVD